MAQLTWRNVDAPNFSGVGDSIRTFSNLLGNATGGLSDAIGNFQSANRQTNDSTVLANALRFQDPNEYRNALASGALFNGIDPTNLSSRALNQLDNRTGSLLEQATAQQGLDYRNYNFNRAQDLDARNDAATAGLNQLSQAYQTGDPTKIAAAQKQYGNVLDTLPADVAMSFANQLQGQSGNAINQRSNLFNLGTNMRDDSANQDAIAALSQIRRGALSPDDARILSEGYSNELTPNAQARLQDLLAREYPGTYGNLGSGSSAGTPAPGGGIPGTRSGNAYDVTFGYTPTATPITQMSIGDVTKHQTAMQSSLGHSPVGAFQINKSTLEDFAPKVLGANWREQPLSAENQDKIGKAIFDARKNGNLKDTWAALPNSNPGAYKDMSWEDIKPAIARAETQMEISQGNQAVSNLATGLIGTRLMQNNTVGVTPDYLGSLNDTSTTGEVVNTLLENDFKGADRNWVNNRINDIAQRAGVSPAMAANVMRRALVGVPESLFFRGLQGLNPFITNEAGNDSRLDDDKVNAMIAGLKRGEPLEASVRNLSVAQSAQNIQQAQTAYDQAVANLNATNQRISTGQTALTALLPAREAAVNKAQQMLQAAQGQVQADPDNLAPLGFTSQAETTRKANVANDERARRYLEQANKIPGYNSQ